MIRLNPRSLRWKFMLAPIVGSVLIIVLALVLIRSTGDELAKLERLNGEEAATGEFLTRIGDELSVTHGSIYQLLLEVDPATDESALFDQSKQLLNRLDDIDSKIRADLLIGNLAPAEVQEVRRFLGLFGAYMSNVSNAFLMATVDTGLSRRTMEDAATYYTGLNTVMFNISRLVDARLDRRLSDQAQAMKERADLFATLFFTAALGMLVIGMVLSRILSRDLHVVTAQLESVLEENGFSNAAPHRERAVVDTLRSAVEGVRENYASLDRTRQELESTVNRQGELIRAQQEAEEARDLALVAAERANAAKSDFLANMSHELRTPLNAIIGFAEMIRRATYGPLNSRYREYATDIGMAGEHLLDLVTDVLDIARIEAGELDIKRDSVDIEKIVRSCDTMLRLQAENAGVTIFVEIPPTIPQLITDPFRFRQILINLMENAIKYTPRGGTISVQGIAHCDGRLAIRVSDSGIGMAKEDIPIALEKFSQLRQGHLHAHSGVGVGLAIVKLLVDLLEGEMQIESEVGIGTTVTITLPKHLTKAPLNREISTH